MKLTPTSTIDNIVMHCNSGVGRENSFSKGFNKPQILIAVFLCLSVVDSPIMDNLLHIMMGLFGQCLPLVAPLRGILTPYNSIANTVRSIDDVYPIQSKGITNE